MNSCHAVGAGKDTATDGRDTATREDTNPSGDRVTSEDTVTTGDTDTSEDTDISEDTDTTGSPGTGKVAPWVTLGPSR